MKNFLDQLENLKEAGCYALQVFYGEDVGCDDSDVPKMERRLQITFRPVGVLGSARMLFVGNVQAFLEVDFQDIKPKVVSNPPGGDLFHTDGFYLWGTEDAVERVQKIWPIGTKAGPFDG
jgi:hypothetical protein